MRKDLKLLPHKDDHYVGEDRRWIRAQMVQRLSGDYTPAIVLRRCHVDDPERFTFWDGQWYAIDKG